MKFQRNERVTPAEGFTLHGRMYGTVIGNLSFPTERYQIRWDCGGLVTTWPVEQLSGIDRTRPLVPLAHDSGCA